MPKFEFQLDGVLRQRKNAEQQRQRELAVIQSQMNEFREQMRQLDLSVRDIEKDMRENRLIGRIDLTYLAAHRRFAFSMQRKALALAERMAAVQLKINEAQKNLNEAVKARKAMEKLREKQFDRWREALARHETLELDEVTIQMGRQQREADQEAGIP
ncbi:MAG: flagellar export protein FliJ [Tepidisphaeraceae bacterium]|jgi:flagellar FliJ protein